jgi:hypothetical protein
MCVIKRESAVPVRVSGETMTIVGTGESETELAGGMK